jgi:hypothetical protein
VDKIKALVGAIFGYILRLSVFQIGLMHWPCGKTLMRLYQKCTSDPHDEKPLDRARLQRSKDRLTSFGAQYESLKTADGGATIEVMTFKSSDFLQKIEAMGGEKRAILLNGEARTAILPRRGADPKEFQLLKEHLEKFFLTPVDVQTDVGQERGILLPPEAEILDETKRPWILDINSPGRSKDMKTRFLGLHLPSYNVCLFDPRGTIDSTGEPSEGGYYLDAEAAFKHLLSKGVRPDRIYISGYCAGAGIGAYLKKKYHHLGVHFIAQNPYNKLLDMVKTHGWLARTFGELAMPSIQSKNPAITSLVEQDGFDLEAKFRNLLRSEGKFIFIDTDTDKRVRRDSVDLLAQAVGNAGPVIRFTRKHPNPKADGHMQNPIEMCSATWRRYIQVVN